MKFSSPVTSVLNLLTFVVLLLAVTANQLAATELNPTRAGP